MQKDAAASDVFSKFLEESNTQGRALQGFIIGAGVGDTSTVRICTLDATQRLDTPWPQHRLPTRASVTALGWYPQAHLHIVAVTRPVSPQSPKSPNMQQTSSFLSLRNTDTSHRSV